MLKATIKHIAALALFFAPMTVDAQMPIYDPMTGKAINSIGEQRDYRTEAEKKADEDKEKAGKDTTEKRERKPLESFFLDD